MSVAHDFAKQRAETYRVFDDLARTNDLPDTADVEYDFLSGPEANWEAAAAALSGEGFEVDRIEADPEDPDATDWLRATLGDQPLSGLSIWLGEEIATRIALAHGFVPDGWGFTG